MTTQTVMLVEDEPEIREMLTFALTRAGFSTVGAVGIVAVQLAAVMGEVDVRAGKSA